MRVEHYWLMSRQVRQWFVRFPFTNPHPSNMNKTSKTFKNRSKIKKNRLNKMWPMFDYLKQIKKANKSSCWPPKTAQSLAG